MRRGIHQVAASKQLLTMPGKKTTQICRFLLSFGESQKAKAVALRTENRGKGGEEE